MTEEVADASSVTLAFWVGSGGREEGAGLHGASHFLEHLLFKGTAGRSGTEIARWVDARGGDMNAFTAQEHTVFYLRLLGEAAEEGVDLLCDIVSAPTLALQDMETEREVILDEVLMHGDDPADVAVEAACEGLFAPHPLGRDVLGTEASISALSPASLREFFGAHYRPGNMVFVATGAVDHEAIVARLASRLGRSGGARPARRPPGGARRGALVRERPSEQAHIVVAWRAPSARSERRLAMEVLDHVMGGGMSSRLFQEVRERRGLAYSVGSDWQPYSDAGSFLLYAASAPARAEQVREVLCAQAAEIVRGGVSEDEFRGAKEHLRAALLLASEEPAARMARLGREQLLFGRVETVPERLATLERLGVDEVSELASEVMSEEALVVAVGPFPGADLPVPPPPSSSAAVAG